MNLDNARTAKAELLHTLFDFSAGQTSDGVAWKNPFERLAMTMRFGLMTPLNIQPRGPASPIAIGIRRSRAKDKTELVLIGSDPAMRDHPSVEKALQLVKGEARFVYGGSNRLLSYWRPARVRPLAPGISVAHMSVPCGTLGAFVTLADGTIGILSNNHVLANLNQGKPGEDILQPGPSDGGNPTTDIVAKLLKFVALDLSPGAINHVDCAVASLDSALRPTCRLASDDGSAPEVKGLADSELLLDDPVWKVGRTTGLTRGKIFAVEVDNYIVDVGTPLHPLRVRFDNQIQVYADGGNFSAPGDSGSLVLDDGGKAHGLLFAGSSAGGPSGWGLATINPLGPVLGQLGVDLWTQP